jgi:predicted nucleic acid-binding protein
VILVDTSAWVEFVRATGSPAHKRLERAVASGERLATTGMVLLEVLSGAHDERHADDLRRLLARARYLRVEEAADHEAAAAIYRACRSSGQTVRSLADCLIAAIAIRTRASLLCSRATRSAPSRRRAEGAGHPRCPAPKSSRPT